MESRSDGHPTEPAAQRPPGSTHFGFTRTPFGKSLAPSELFTRAPHEEAVARIRHCIAESALGVITGEVGTGKTVAARAARASLDPSRHALIYIANPAFGTRGLYVSVVRALGGTPRFHKAEVMAQTSELLEAEEAERHRRVVIVVDEAHLLTPEQLEELRLLTNTDMDSRSPLRGHPAGPADASPGSSGWGCSRRSTSASPCATTSGPWTSATRPRTCATTWRSPDGSDQLFADDAIVRLHRQSNGIPRALNNVAIAALIAAASDGKEIVDDACAKKAVAELTRE